MNTNMTGFGCFCVLVLCTKEASALEVFMKSCMQKSLFSDKVVLIQVKVECRYLALGFRQHEIRFISLFE